LTAYKLEYAKQAKRLARLGALDRDLADFFEVNIRTIHRWKIEHEDFAKSLKAGKKVVDDKVEQSLLARATGYSFDSEHIAVTQDGEVVRAPTVEHCPPDVQAARWWMANRRPKEWSLTPRGARKALDFGTLDGSAKSISDAGVNVLRLMAAGELSVEEGQAAAMVLASVSKALEVGELEMRLSGLEGAKPRQITHVQAAVDIATLARTRARTNPRRIT